MIEGEQIARKRLPKNKLGLGLFLFAFSAAFGIALTGGRILPGIGKKQQADRGYQDEKKKANIGFDFHELVSRIGRN